ncbi:MAG: NADH-quinone oxidoreductase subunit B family protein [Chloroflexota bacterium]
MLNILRASWRTGRVTEGYPNLSEGPSLHRGRPRLDPALCVGTGDCAAVCPSGAITLDSVAAASSRWRLDLARCLFCGLCVEACPHGALAMTGDFELASRTRHDLIAEMIRSDPPARDGGQALGGAGCERPPVLCHAVGGSNPDDGRVRGLLKRSLHVRHLAAGSDNSTDWEIAALLNPIYDVQRLGIDFVASPRHADLLLVTGAVTRHLEPALRATYEAMPSPRLVVAAGNEACGGGLLRGSYAVAGGVDRCLPVDVYVPGDPPCPEALIQGLLVAMGRSEPTIRRAESPAQASR